MWVVKHKNTEVVGQREEWAVDGAGLNWTKTQAEVHAARCEFEEHGIPFQVVEDTVPAIEKPVEVRQSRKSREEK